MSMLKNFFGKKQNHAIKFGADAAPFGKHGIIVANNKAQKLRDVQVPFVFVGMEAPPHLNIELMQQLFDSAREQGYEPLHVLKYGKPATGVAAPKQTAHVPMNQSMAMS